MRKSGLMKAIVTHTLRRAASTASQIRRNAGSPSISGRTPLPGRAGYEARSMKGYTAAVARSYVDDMLILSVRTFPLI
jgi:hypothetical protein